MQCFWLSMLLSWYRVCKRSWCSLFRRRMYAPLWMPKQPSYHYCFCLHVFPPHCYTLCLFFHHPLNIISVICFLLNWYLIIYILSVWLFHDCTHLCMECSTILWVFLQGLRIVASWKFNHLLPLKKQFYLFKLLFGSLEFGMWILLTYPWCFLYVDYFSGT